MFYAVYIFVFIIIVYTNLHEQIQYCAHTKSRIPGLHLLQESGSSYLFILLFFASVVVDQAAFQV